MLGVNYIDWLVIADKNIINGKRQLKCFATLRKAKRKVLHYEKANTYFGFGDCVGPKLNIISGKNTS